MFHAGLPLTALLKTQTFTKSLQRKRAPEAMLNSWPERYVYYLARHTETGVPLEVSTCMLLHRETMNNKKSLSG